MKTKTNKSAKLRDFICVICNKPFQNYVSPSEIKTGRGKVCSRECMKKYSSIANRRGENRNCVHCGNAFYSKKSEDRRGYIRRFCSMNCFNNYPKSEATRLKSSNSLKKVIHTEEWNEKVRLSKIGDKNPMYVEGKFIGKYPVEWKEALKESIRIRDEFTCGLCKKKYNNKKHKQRFPVHHIDYQKDNCDPKNLITLCNGCHTKTNIPNRRNHYMAILDEAIAILYRIKRAKKL